MIPKHRPEEMAHIRAPLFIWLHRPALDLYGEFPPMVPCTPYRQHTYDTAYFKSGTSTQQMAEEISTLRLRLMELEAQTLEKAALRCICPTCAEAVRSLIPKEPSHDPS